MPIIVNLDVMLARRKMSLSQLSQQVDVTIANLSVLKTNKAKAVRFTTLEAICRALDCQPGDLLEYVEEQAVILFLLKKKKNQKENFCGKTSFCLWRPI